MRSAGSEGALRAGSVAVTKPSPPAGSSPTSRAVDAAEEAKREQVASVEAARMATAAARMMEATARAALALDRLKNGNRQTVVVQYVTVADGGQAVVAGTVPPGAGGSERGSPGTEPLCGLSGSPSAADGVGRCGAPLRRPPAARRAAVPRAGHAQRPLPQARRSQHGLALAGGDGPAAASAVQARRARR